MPKSADLVHGSSLPRLLKSFTQLTDDSVVSYVGRKLPLIAATVVSCFVVVASLVSVDSTAQATAVLPSRPASSKTQASSNPPPSSKPQPSSKTQAKKPTLTTYKVKAGDTLTAIAIRFRVSSTRLLDTNSNILRQRPVLLVGQRLLIPAAEAPTGLPASIKYNPQRLRLRKIIRLWAKRNSVPPDLAEATLYLESGWNQRRVSSTGAVGVGQLMPNTASYIRSELIGTSNAKSNLDEHVVEHNIRMSVRYLHHLLTVTNGDSTRALQGYFQGFGSISSNGIYPESRAYAAAIQSLRVRFRQDSTGLT